MSEADDFIRDYNNGRLVFLVGAGASFGSGAPAPAAVVAASARLFLPSGSLADSIATGIQPEVFYENLLAVSDDPKVLHIWRVLSPLWLNRKGTALHPNLNHIAVSRYAGIHGVPVFTMNFDMLLEAAAGTGGETIIPLAGRSAPAGPLPAGRVRIYKLHGSIMVDGREGLETLRTTMQGISAVNPAMLQLMQDLARTHTFAFVGYSGRDIDYFPALSGLSFDTPPYWFNPFAEADLRQRISAVGAREIAELPDALFTRILAPYPIPHQPDLGRLLSLAESEIPVRLEDPQKELLMAMCLQSMGRNDEARRWLYSLQLPHLSPRGRIEALLQRAWVDDCTSQYANSETSAKAAEEALREASDDALVRPERLAYRARAIYLRNMAHQQQYGPFVSYGASAVDWNPGFARMGLILTSGVAALARLSLIRWRLRLSVLDQQRVPYVRAVHAINDHEIVVVGRIISFAKRFRRLFAVTAAAARVWARRMRGRALNSGDYRAFGHANKYLTRTDETINSRVAVEAYALLQDPLNAALVYRDSGQALLERGDVPGAVAAFRQGLDKALSCGSRATAVKCCAGLAACGAITDQEKRIFVEQAKQIQGSGYSRYFDERVKRLDSRAGGVVT